MDCAGCGHQEVHYHPCQDRHCPTCSGVRTARWLDARQDKLLPVPHFQVVFTLPNELRALARAAPEPVYGLLMSAAANSLQDVLRSEYGARFAITAVLHTWTRELLFHPHVYMIVSAGGLSLNDASWTCTWSSAWDCCARAPPLPPRAPPLRANRRRRRCHPPLPPGHGTGTARLVSCGLAWNAPTRPRNPLDRHQNAPFDSIGRQVPPAPPRSGSAQHAARTGRAIDAGLWRGWPRACRNSFGCPMCACRSLNELGRS